MRLLASCSAKTSAAERPHLLRPFECWPGAVQSHGGQHNGVDGVRAGRPNQVFGRRRSSDELLRLLRPFECWPGKRRHRHEQDTLTSGIGGASLSPWHCLGVCVCVPAPGCGEEAGHGRGLLDEFRLPGATRRIPAPRCDEAFDLEIAALNAMRCVVGFV